MTGTVPNDSGVDAAAVLDLLTGGWAAQMLRAVAQLRIADLLADGPATAEQIAEHAGSDPRATYRLMRAASSLGVLSYEGDRRFGLTGREQLLRTDVRGSLGAMVQALNEPSHWMPWMCFPDAVRQGRTQARAVLGTDVFDYLARPENTEEAALFSRAMGDFSALVATQVVAAVDTTGVSTVVDVGGANGDLVFGLMQADPHLHGQVLDLPHVVEGAWAEAVGRGLSGRFSVVAGDFFAEVPPADLYLLKHVLHDWADEQAITILRNCRAAVNPSGRALIVELVIGELGSPDFATRMDMNMLALSSGMERDFDEYDALFTASGWRWALAHSVGGGYYILELVPA